MIDVSKISRPNEYRNIKVNGGYKKFKLAFWILGNTKAHKNKANSHADSLRDIGYNVRVDERTRDIVVYRSSTKKNKNGVYESKINGISVIQVVTTEKNFNIDYFTIMQSKAKLNAMITRYITKYPKGNKKEARKVSEHLEALKKDVYKFKKIYGIYISQPIYIGLVSQLNEQFLHTKNMWKNAKK